ncbi:MAG: polyphosphate kinase 2 family protein [Ignavibacteriae bacterium]|nr:polyphosphate kinase 2 family protein [Ignavibacteriota bacterium]MCB9258647.1 polyphosphate kinase 2 family protein [Ignavibacteriales bacterium]
MNLDKFKISDGKNFKISEFKTDFTGDLDSKKEAEKRLKKNKEKMRELQDKFYAHDKFSLLIIFQAMDAAGKDSSIKHVMSGLNPQGTQVFSFKQPSKEELDHDYLWRTSKSLPERGRIGIFNRSYYEEVLVVKVHNLVKYQNIPSELVTDNIWTERYNQIRNFEQHISQNGTVILKFFLNVSKNEQKSRFLKRLDTPSKNWKFSAADLEERKLWDEYQKCYQQAIRETSTDFAPWYIIPADHKWFARLLISEIINDTLENLKIEYPSLSDEQIANLEIYKKQLIEE